MHFFRNPISESRRGYLQKYVFNQVAQSAVMDFDPKRLPEIEILKKTKVGPFKLILWVDQRKATMLQLIAPKDIPTLNTPYILSGTEVIYIPSPKDPKETQSWVESQWKKYQETAKKLSDHAEITTKQLIIKIAEADPTESGDYSLWIAKQIFSGHLHIGVDDDEDIDKVQEDLTLFEIRKRRNIIPKERRDINQYRTYSEFFETLKEFGGLVNDVEALTVALKQGNIVHQSPIWQVIEIKNWKLAKRLAKGTAWCVRGTDQAQQYLRDPEKYPLFLFLKNGEKFALLTNLPDRQQFANPNDEPIDQKVIEKDPELKDLVIKFSNWIFCENCERFYWGKEIADEDKYHIAQRIISSLRNERDFSGISEHLGRSWLIAEIPSPNLQEDMVGRPEIFANKIVIGGPARKVLGLPGVQLPNVDSFAEKAGYKPEEYVSDIIQSEGCDICHSLKDEHQTFIDAQHALYVLKACEDYPCCGHEPLSMGAPGCPPCNTDGLQIGMRCVCAAFVPSSSRSSLCRTCLKAPDPDDPFSEDREFRESEEREPEEYDGCPVEDFDMLLERTVKRWSKIEDSNWGVRDYQGEFVQGPKWETFMELMGFISNYHTSFSSTVQAFLEKNDALFSAIADQGWFDRQILKENLLPVLSELQKLLEINNKSDHQNCCDEPLD